MVFIQGKMLQGPHQGRRSQSEVNTWVVVSRNSSRNSEEKSEGEPAVKLLYVGQGTHGTAEKEAGK